MMSDGHAGHARSSLRLRPPKDDQEDVLRKVDLSEYEPVAYYSRLLARCGHHHRQNLPGCADGSGVVVGVGVRVGVGG